MRRKWLVTAVFALIAGGFGWRFWPRPLSDEAQIARNIENLVAGANNRRASDVTFYLAADFFFGVATRNDLRAQLAGAFFGYRVVNLTVSGVQTESDSSRETARTRGAFRLVLKRESNGPEEIQSGNFAAKWRKIEGEWKVDEANIKRNSG